MATAIPLFRAVEQPAVLAVGFQNPRRIRRVEGAVREAGAPVEVVAGLGDIRRLVARAPAAIILNASAACAEEVCLTVRSEPDGAATPIVVVSEKVTDLAFQEVFGWGADDLVDIGRPSALARRLRAVLPIDRTTPAARGAVVVADPDRRARAVYARVLRAAGYDVSFAVDADETFALAMRSDVALVVCSSAIELAAGGLVRKARRAGATAKWTIASAPRDFGWCREQIAGLASAAVHDAFSPPENLLFLANELEASAVVNCRASARLLYGTTVRFRPAGAERDEVGYSYNVSRGGLYVRTLAPPPSGAEVWMEYRPPRCDRFVRLEGQVAWTRDFGAAARAVVPPGFGVRIIDASRRDLERQESGCDAFESQLAGVAPDDMR